MCIYLNRQADRRAGGQAGRQTDRQTDRHRQIHPHTHDLNNYRPAFVDVNRKELVFKVQINFLTCHKHYMMG